MSEQDGARLQKDFLEAKSLLDRGLLDESLEIFLRLYDAGQKNQSSTIAWIYSKIEDKDLKKAKYYYSVASDQGDSYAQHALGGIYFAEGDTVNAVKFYEMAANNGRKECYHLIYRILKSEGKNSESTKYLDMAYNAGDNFAIRDTALRYASGAYGISQIPKGIAMYVRNIPRLIKTARNITKNSDFK